MEDLSRKIADRIDARKRALSEAAVACQYAQQPQIWTAYGNHGNNMSLRDGEYHFTYLIEALRDNDPGFFADYAVWLRRLFEGLRFPPDTLRSLIQCAREVLGQELPPDMSAVTNRFLEVALTDSVLQAPPEPSFLVEGAPMCNLAATYLDTLLKGDRHEAGVLIMDAVNNGLDIRDIYLYVFQPCLYEIGRLWLNHEISVAQEHYCSAATQLIMSRLYPRIFATQRIGHKLVAACVGSELHEIGMRMAADFFEIDGWDTYYLGANTPVSGIMDALRLHKPHVLAVSVSMPFHRSDLADLIALVRETPETTKIKILVGGYTFKTSPQLWQRFGADAYAEDARQAVFTANRFVRNGRRP